MQAYFQKYFPQTPTAQQREVFQAVETFLRFGDPFECFLLKGYAGTGKTTLIRSFVQTLPHFKMRTCLLAPTGRAAKVMQKYSGKQAYTIHKKIYRKKNAATPDMEFAMAENKHVRTLFIVDEASMISDEKVFFNQRGLLSDLIDYVYSGTACRLMLVGDTAQLPPVGLQESPALNPEVLSRGHGLEVHEAILTEVIRQEQDSGILFNATHLRDQIHVNQGGFPHLHTAGFTDIYRMSGEKLLEGLHYAYDKYGMEQVLVVCRSNKHANLYNRHIRNSILGREEELSGGDYIMVVKNNYYWKKSADNNLDFIANGEMATITRVGNVHEQHGFRFADVTLEWQDEDNTPLSCRVLLDTLHTDAPGLSREDAMRLYKAIEADYADIPRKRERQEAIKNDPYYNALHIKFAMAVTCHKAQGGQWEAVFVDQGYLTEDRIDTEFLRWLYTAVTRATRELYLVNFHKSFFD